MEKEHIKKLLYSFLKGKEYLNKTVISQNLSIIDEVIESSEQNKSVKLVGIKNTSDIDRNIIKIKAHLKGKHFLDSPIKKKIIEEINNTMNKKYLYNGKNLSLQSIMQRQVYKLTGAFMQQNQYKSYIFKW